LIRCGRDVENSVPPWYASSMRSSERTAMAAVFGADWESIDLREADVEVALERFRARKRGEMTEGSIGTYASRVRAHVRSRLRRGDAPPTETVNYRFPMTDGSEARLSLPRRLVVADAERLAAFLKTLVINSSSP
jgi:hypothetical protein